MLENLESALGDEALAKLQEQSAGEEGKEEAAQTQPIHRHMAAHKTGQSIMGNIGVNMGLDLEMQQQNLQAKLQMKNKLTL
ncbi:hypothetical protein M422DRAFT_251953 [Sphaerobolus stellatus SS14]|uniref:Uncharacterized protein n=1 Tax=Sphaerobolus stellatus (strain SS14) TaxID=990650 RepID=A0A0C9UNS1_SPHS4|nr:hypothetical protein M422DRAFT_251953 [Sphaerobolus stellatus SS14]